MARISTNAPRVAQRKTEARGPLAFLTSDQIALLDVYIARCPEPRPSREEAVGHLLSQYIPRALGALYDDLSIEQTKQKPHGASYGDGKYIYITTNPRFQRIAIWMLQGIEKAGGCKDGVELLQTIHVCGREGLPLPMWIVKDLLNRLQKLTTFETASWEDAFGRVLPNRARLAKSKRDHELRPRVHSRVMEIRQEEPRAAIDIFLFERVGREFGIGKTLCEELFYEAERSRTNNAPLSVNLKGRETEAVDIFAANFRNQREKQKVRRDPRRRS